MKPGKFNRKRVAAFRAFASDAPETEDSGALAQFVFLILALAVIVRIAA